jgi:regulator of protease activity HflC (stomatin/prohibitin superfamily)
MNPLAALLSGVFSGFIPAAFFTFVACFIAVPILLALTRLVGFYVIVEERTCRVYVLFGKVIGMISEPGLHSLVGLLGLRAFCVNWMGRCYVVDLRLDQEYLRSQPVNSEEGAPMGIGIWYEMFVSDPVSYLFKNADPRGSLRSNVSNASVRCLSNMKLADMLETRHKMSQSVRSDVSEKSRDWGYQLGSVYIRKVHFRDTGMITQIEAKVVNRLRQVTSSILQDGANQVSIIRSTADREAAAAFAQAAAMRPQIVGAALNQISSDPEIEAAMFDILEYQKMQEGDGRLILIPEKFEMLADLLATTTTARGDTSATATGNSQVSPVAAAIQSAMAQANLPRT